MKTTTVVTTSWDDGHPTDLRVAELLASHGVLGTFYVACNHPKGPDLNIAQLRYLRQMGMEIGSHTFTHRLLTGRPRNQVLYELTESRKALEDMLGESVTALSYPEGAFNRVIRSAAREAGYALGRTTMAFRTSPTFDASRMPVSVLFFPYTQKQHVRHALRDANVSGLFSWSRTSYMETDLVKLTHRFFDRTVHHGGIFHLCARSWEIDQLDLWEILRQALSYVSRRADVRYVPNSAVGAASLTDRYSGTSRPH